MKYKILLLFVTVLLLCTTVYAVGEAGKPYNFYNVEKCYGDIKVRVYPLEMNQYSLFNCTKTNLNDWTCLCSKGLYILTPENTTSRFSALVQYNIGPLKNVTPSIDGTLTNEEMYNDELKRVFTIKDIIITPKALTSGALSQNENVNDILLMIVISGGALLFLVFMIILIFWLFHENIRRWLGLEEEEKITLGKIMRRIFTRENIQRKELVRKNGKILPIVKPIEKKEEVVIKKEESKAADEIRKMLEELDK